MEKDKETTKRRQLKGIVSSDRMDKTVTVTVSTTKKHKKYLKYHKVSQRFKAHDENNEHKVGDEVVIEESKPISKDKRWRVIEKI